MRQPRLKAPAEWPLAYYHCVSRVVDRRQVLGSEEKAMFVKLMRFYERLCQVRLISYCVMSNHFHLLVEVPQRPSSPPTQHQILAHIARCHGSARAKRIAEQVRHFERIGAHTAAQRLLDAWLWRMWDISPFMKTLKQRFTQWFNKRHGRRGTLWEDRYASTIIEGSTEALAMVGAYIDLNPVRAGVVADPKDYLWSGYGAALAGSRQAVRGIERVVQHFDKSPPVGTQALAHYRMALFGAGDGGDERTQGLARQIRPHRRGISGSAVARVLREGGRLSRWQMLRCRVRYFSAGAVIGSRAFVNAIFKARRDRFGPKRVDGARPMRGANFDGLCSLRDLRHPAALAPP